MARKRIVWAIVSLAVFSLPLALWRGRPHTDLNEEFGLPGTVLSDHQMQTVLGGATKKKEPKKNKQCPTEKGAKKGNNLHISSAHGSVETDVAICTVQSADGPTIGFMLHYDSTKADGSIGRWQTVLGYGWTHNYNIHLIVRSRDVLLPDRTGTLTGFRLRFDGGYMPDKGQTHTLTRVDADTFLLEEVDGRSQTFELFDPAPWPENGQLFQLTRIEDAQGRITTLSYSAGGLLETIEDPYGRQVSLTYNANNRIETITNADSEITQFEYQDADDDLWRIADPLGYTLEYTYDSQNRLTTEKLKDGNTWTCVYNGAGKPHQLIDGDGQVLVTLTNPLNWAIDIDHALQFNEVRYIPSQTTVTDGRGNVTIYHYDENAYITTTERPGHPDKTYEFNDDLRVTRITDEEGNFWYYEYDEHLNTTRITDPLGNETQMFYEHPTILSLLTKKIEPDDDVWEYEYDAFGNLTMEIDPIIETPDDRVNECEYEYYLDPPPGRLMRKTCTDRNGHVTQWEYNEDGTLWHETVDPGGLDIITEYEYDVAGRLTLRRAYRGPGPADPVETAYEYDAMGRLTQKSLDPPGLDLTTLYEYDGEGRRIRVINPRGVPTEYEYDARGQLWNQIVDPGDPPDHLNLTTEYGYDDCDNLVWVRDPNGNETTHEYDDRNRLVKTIDAEGYWTEYEYDDRGNQTFVKRSIDPGGPPYRVAEYRYDELSRRTHEIVDPWDPPEHLNLVTEYEYAPPGGGCCHGTPGRSLIHKITDPEGKVTYYYYDQLDRRTSVVGKVGDVEDNEGDADDAITRYDYDYMFNRIGVTVENDPDTDLVTDYAYDAADRLEVQVVGTVSSLTTSYVYDGASNVIEETTRVGNVITRVYDKADRLISESDSIGAVADYTYDENGNVLTEADGLGHPWTYTYDTADRHITACDPLVETPTDKCTTYEYDANGNLIQVTDNEGLVTTYTYDGLDRRLSMTKDPGGVDITITYAYDGAGNQTQITDDNGNTTAYEYDAANRLTRELYADETDVLFSHDAAGNRTSRTDQMDNVTSYTYDDLHRLIMRDYAEEVPVNRADTFTYDRAGRMLTADNEHSHVGYAYDDVGRITSSTQTDLPLTYSYTVGYAYDTLANTRTLTYPSGKVVVETRDLRNRLADVSDAASYEYDAADRVLTKTFDNGTEARYGYNDNDWITELRHVAPDGVTTFAGFAHNYDAIGNRLNARNLQEPIPYDDAKPVTQSERYGYDPIYRLIDFKRGQWVAGDIPVPMRERTWQLDGVHNWEQFTIADVNDPSEDGTYCDAINQMNEYDDESNDGPCPVPDDDGLPDDFMVPCPPGPGGPGGGHRLGSLGPDDMGPIDPVGVEPAEPLVGDPATPQAGHNRAHDKNGNLVVDDPVDDDAKKYFYDYDHRPIATATLRAENRLTLVKQGGVDLGQYWYDALGRRIRKLAGGVSTVYVYTRDWRAIEEYEDGTPARSYTYGAWIDEVLTMDRAAPHGDRFYYHANALGSIIALTDDIGAPVERYTYDAFGAPSFFDSSGSPIPQSAVGNPYLFTGRRSDAETGLYYYRTRYLDPSAGRFTTRDTIGIWGDGDNLGNGYSYCRNNPWTFGDPLGEQGGEKAKKCCCCCVEDLEIKNIKKIDNATHWGHSFDAVIDLEYKKWDREFADCTLEWWERTDLPPAWQTRLGIKAWTWNDLYARFPTSPTFDGWTKNRKKPCPGKETATITDPPALGKRPGRNVSRTLQFAIKVSSAPDCPCKWTSIVVFATQKLSMKGGKGDTESFKHAGVGGPWPPGIP
ncbi:MAG: hypothetical protein KAY37_10460 [Phycisphaerae bacterium]|nr:hypothetical protein [Phycisphaerae bacterium]